MKIGLLLAGFLSVFAGNVFAACYGRIINPVTDIPWDGVFPITVAGARLSAEGTDAPVTDASAVCACQKGPLLKPGVNLSFSSPSAPLKSCEVRFVSRVSEGLRFPRV